MNIAINFKRIKWYFNNNKTFMYSLFGHTYVFYYIIKTPFYPFKLYICNTLLLTCLHFVKHVFSLTIIFLIFF